jgi:hypothetical protein
VRTCSACQPLIYVVAVKFRSVYDSSHPRGLTRLLPGSGGAGTLKTNVQMRERTGDDLYLGLASSHSGPLPLQPDTSLIRGIARDPAWGALTLGASYRQLKLFVNSRYA